RTHSTPSRDAVWSMTHELRPGDSYTALVYDPNPSGALMRRAGTAFPVAARRYVSFDLPGRGAVEAPFWSHRGPASIADRLDGTPYAGMYGLAQRLAAGGRDPERNNFLVDDTDAHDWVEVFFPSIGWVTFEPTPAAAPAATQLDDNALGVTKPGPSSDANAPTSVVDPRGGDAPVSHR